ncbi:MAG: sugar phosphate isomerase/epimerase [Desulfobacterales bacterium]
MKFSMTSDAYDADQSIEERLIHFSNAGFSHIHWCEQATSDKLYTPEDADGIRRAADMVGLKIQNIHSVWRFDGNRPFSERDWYELNRNRIEFISQLGGDCIVLHIPQNLSDRYVESDRKESERLINLLQPVARKHGVRLAIENMENAPCRPLFDYLFALFAPDELGFCFDSGHAHITGELEILEHYMDRLILTHLHDNRGRADEHLLPGHGTINWKPIISSLKKNPDLRIINIEVFWSGDVPKDQWSQMAYRSIADLWGS